MLEGYSWLSPSSHRGKRQQQRGNVKCVTRIPLSLPLYPSVCPEHTNPQQGVGVRTWLQQEAAGRQDASGLSWHTFHPPTPGIVWNMQGGSWSIRSGAPCTSPVSHPARVCFWNLRVPSNTETGVSPQQCWNSSLYPTIIILCLQCWMRSFNSPSSQLFSGSLLVWAAVPALQTQPGS